MASSARPEKAGFHDELLSLELDDRFCEISFGERSMKDALFIFPQEVIGRKGKRIWNVAGF